MIVAVNFSIRNLLQGELQTFVRASGFECLLTLDFVRDLTCLLAAYREEDTALFPEVFILPSVERIQAISPGASRIPIGVAPLAGELSSKVLKDCAPLAVNGWATYVAKRPVGTPQLIEYGLFRSLRHSFATSAEEAMSDSANDAPVLLVRNRGHLIVELSNAKNESLTVSFTSTPIAESSFVAHVGQLVAATMTDLPKDLSDRFKPYFNRFLIDTLQRCHGTLIAALRPKPDGLCPESLQRGIWLTPPLPIALAHAEAADAKDAECLARLQSFEALLTGMINSDGVVVLGTNGTVLGYRVFLTPSDAEKQTQEQEGGGRRRTYSLMRMRLDTVFTAAFFRSQDGSTACERSAK